MTGDDQLCQIRYLREFRGDAQHGLPLVAGDPAGRKIKIGGLYGIDQLQHRQVLARQPAMIDIYLYLPFRCTQEIHLGHSFYFGKSRGDPVVQFIVKCCGWHIGFYAQCHHRQGVDR